MITDELMVYISIYSHLEFSMTTATAVVGELKGGAGTGSNPGVDTICGLSLLLVLSLAPRGFSPGTPVFPSPEKPTFPNSNSTRNQVDEKPLCGCATCNRFYSFILFIYLIFHMTLSLIKSRLSNRLLA